MIQDSYTALTQEPWCFTVEQIARLTDWQIVELYLKPANERSERMRADMPATPGKTVNAVGSRREPSPDSEPGTEAHRRQIVAGMMGTMGMPRQRAEAEYDRQLAEWQATQTKG